MIDKIISHYKILEKLGGGGMGVVYKAEDTRLKRRVALKFLPPSLSLDEDAKKRFINEARTASSLQHHNICNIHDIDETGDGQLFICMDLYEGKTLKEKIESGQIETNEAVDIIIQAATGLQKAHEKGIIHRDIKPANIFVTKDGVVKILDFGLAKLKGQTIMTKMGDTMGTVAYMSPEQARGEEVDQRSDIWSLGAVLYEILTGQRPFKSDYDQAVVYLILNEDPKSPSLLRNNLSEDLVKIILKLLNKNPDDRYQNPDELISELEYFRDSTIPHKTSTSTHSIAKPKSKLLWLASLVIIILISVIVISQYILKDESRPISSIAVLPLKNLTGDPDQEYFSDGMTEALILELGQSGSFKRVISLTSVMSYKDKKISLPKIAAELGVEAVVEGSFSHYGDRVHITAQLINGKDDRLLWTKKFDSNLQNILQLQSNIARDIVTGIKLKLSPEDSVRFTHRRMVNADAYQYYMQGNYQLNKLNDTTVLKAIDFFEKAIAIDSTYSPAYVGLADAYSKRSWAYAPISARLADQKAEAYAMKAVKLDDKNAEAYSVLGQVYLNKWIWHDAGVELEKAITLNPNSASARQNYSLYLMVIGKFEQSISEIKTARQLDPLSIYIRTQVGWPYWFSGRYKQSLNILKEVVNLEPNFALANYNIGLSYIMLNNPDAAIAAYHKALELAPGNILFESHLWYARAIKGDTEGAKEFKRQLVEQWRHSPNFSPYFIAIVSAGLNETDEVLKYLELAISEHDAFTVVLPIEPVFRKYRSYPRFKKLVKKMGLDEYFPEYL